MITKPLLAVQADIDKIKYPVLATPKLDGIRCLIVNGVAVSRNFKPIPNNYIRERLLDLPDGLDGEIMLADHRASFQSITSAVMSFTGEPHFRYCIFDYVKEALDKPYFLRIEDLEDFYHPGFRQDGHLKRILPLDLANNDEVAAYESECLEEGYEGIMLRHPEGYYKCGRSTVKEGILLKVKRFEDSEAEIIDLFEKETNTNEQTRDELGRAKRSTAKAGKVKAGTLGALLVNDIKTGIQFQIGSGFDDAIRAEIWADQSKYYGKIIKYKFQAIGVKEAPRFPVFLGFRSQRDM